MNYVYFLGYDKLKPYGFPIHGALDGYSCKILWLEVTRSNNKPENVDLDCIKGNEGCPTLLRSNCGTEIGVMAGMQCYFCQSAKNGFAGEKAHTQVWLFTCNPAKWRLVVSLVVSQPSDEKDDLYQEYFDYVVDHEALQLPT